MATPMSTTSQEDTSNKKLEQITFRFCSECSNMLYPKEDEETHKLQFTCRTCQFTEEAQSTCVFRNVMNNAAGETAGVTQDVGSDPTVGHSQPVLAPVVCIECGHAILCTGCGNPSDEFDVSVVSQPNTPKNKKMEITWDDLMEMAEDDAMDEYDEEKEPTDAINQDFANINLHHQNPAPAAQHVSWPTFQLALPRSNKECPVCKGAEAVFFQSQQRSAETGMKLFYVCCDCGHIFQ
ncbi:DNA-directed RNA polymerase II subunit RPB9 [Colletotrichum gloeosporioides]|uniref:DNA-directed RNA polymerase II subunit RPB9 n=1 Tax=Colletotrichum gloeosporioides TaxID=474922 RepID=A0A8H4FG33_COLGL|nr:DNA-directed RNA polymerase II subunit RPB9 [Colletotrichum gloeosporioides]KAF3800735.1 DNA-directed RNA polymerase II subunit RPB9 [Colletotrichum gloeosporioides]